MNNDKPVLLIEDDHVDVLTIKRAFRESNIHNRLEVVSNGENAIEYLTLEENEKPGIIFLDLNMPRMNGVEFLKYLKSHEELKMIPVIVLTTSSDKKDIQSSFEYNIAGYITKPLDYGAFLKSINIINKYWTRCSFPERANT